uniref:Uncharacterized protein n=1 Tax=Acrobeloides nanus TaxID=290746 RepID=A0A914C437_9BILA
MSDLNEWISPKGISDSDDQEYQSEESDPGADNKRARSIAQKKTASFDPSDNVLSFYFCEWKDLLKYFLHGKTVKLEVDIWSQESVNAAEVENEFLYNELEYLINKVEGLIAEDVNRENEIAKEKALSDQLRKENEDLKAKLKKLLKERDEAYKYKTIFEEDCRKLVHDEVAKIQKSNTPESLRNSERHRRPIRNIQFLMD